MPIPIVPSPVWRVHAIDSIKLGSLTLDRNALRWLPSEDITDLKKVFVRALNSPKGSALMDCSGRDRSPIGLEFSEKGGLVLSVGAKRGAIASAEEILTEPSRKDLLTGKTPFIRQWQTLQRHALRKGIGRIGELSPAQKESAERIERVFEKARTEREETARKNAPKTKLQRIGSTLPDKLSGGINTLSSVSTVLNIIPKCFSIPLAHINRIKTAIGVMGAVSGILTVGVSGFIFRDAIREGRVAYRHGDAVGGAFSVGNAAIGASLAAVGGSTTAVNVGLVAGVAATTAAALPVLAGAGLVFHIIMGALGVGAAVGRGHFRSKMNTILEQEHLTEKEQLYEALGWMRDNVTIGEFEEMEISAKARASDKDPDGELQRALETKWDRFARSTNKEVCEKIYTTVTPDLMQRLQSGDPKALREARLLVGQVSKANFKALVQSVIRIASAVFAAAAIIAGIVVSGSLALTLVLLGASFWVMIDPGWVGNLVNYVAWKMRNAMYPKWNFEVQGKICPSKGPTSSITFSPRRGFRSTPSRHTDGTSKRLGSSSPKQPGPMLDQGRFSASSPLSRRRVTPPRQFAECLSR